jgi:predicted RNase H-like nuclease (RuvC/YqgF family)
MLHSEGRKPGIDFPKIDELEAVVRRALRQLEVWRERASASETERRRLKAVLEKMKGASAQLDPEQAAGELERLRSENEELRHRLEKGRQRVEELFRDVQLLEDAR